MARELIVTVESVTPLFLGGAKARELADAIRPASIRGQVRYWLRAMLGAGIDPTDKEALKTLKESEGKFMGNTEAGSPVRFRVRSDRPLGYVEKKDGGRRMLPHRVAGVKEQRGAPNPLCEAAIIENQTFDIILSPRPGRYTIPNEVVAATLLWLHLGGLGKRSRRGFGSLQPVKWAASEDVLTPEAREHLPNGHPGDAAALRSQLGDLLNWLGGVAGVSTGSWASRSDYPILHADVAGVRVSDAVTGYRLTSYHQAMVPFWRESLRNVDKELKDNRAYGYASNDRRASPFHLHIARTAQGYHQVFTTFWAEPSQYENDPRRGWDKVAGLLADVETEFGATNLWGRAS